jgi:methanogenic corrinoid protein MtbC1
MEDNLVPDTLVTSIAEMKEELALNITRELLAEGADPLIILDDCRKAMEIVGNRFQAGEYFLPELILAGEMLNSISLLVKPYLLTNTVTTLKKGKILIGTVKGDIHDIGKNVVVFMLEANGYEVKDLGVDVPVSKFVEEINVFHPDIVALSSLLTIAHTSMKETVEAINASGMREKVKIMIGGGTVDELVRQFSGADAYGRDALEAVRLAEAWIGEKSVK